MFVSEILLLITGVLLVVLYIWCKHTFSYWKRKGIPYIEPTLLIGNTKEAFTLRRNFGLHLSDVYNDPRMRNEAVVGIYALHQPSLVLRDLEIIKSVLIKDFNSFPNRYAAGDPHRDPLGSNNLFLVKNPFWREMRTKLTPVFTSGKLKQMYPLMQEIAAELEDLLAQKGDICVTEVKETCSLFTTDLIAKTAFGVQANSLKNPNAEFRAKGRTMFLFTLERTFDSFLIFFLPKFVTLFRAKVFPQELSDFLRKTMNYVISQRENSGVTRNDLIDVLVKLKKEAAEDPTGKHFCRESDSLVAQAAVFLTAGFETSSSTMTFTLYELAKHPDLQERLRTEIKEALLTENGLLSYETISSLEYLGMVVDEVLRLYPVLPFLDREYKTGADGKSTYNLKPYYDYTFTDGIPVFIPTYAIHHDPKYWPDPNKFDPERFSAENKKLHHPVAYMPFGTGPRNCIGSRVGKLQTKIGLVHFLKNHYVELCDETLTENTFDPKSFLLQFREALYLKVVNDHLYDNEVVK